MKPLLKTLLMMLLAAAVLAACGDDTASNDATDANDEATEPEENNDSSGNDENQQLSIGDTGVYRSGSGDYEITLNSARIEDEYEGEIPSNGVFVITKMTIKNVSDDPISAADLVLDLWVLPFMTDKQELDDYPYWNVGFFDEEATFEEDFIEEQIEPGESITGEMIFDRSESSDYELLYGLGMESDNDDDIRWKFDVDEIE